MNKDHDIWPLDCVQDVNDCIYLREISVNVWLNYLPFPTSTFCIVK